MTLSWVGSGAGGDLVAPPATSLPPRRALGTPGVCASAFDAHLRKHGVEVGTAAGGRRVLRKSIHVKQLVEKTDRRGRRYCRENGRPVKCPDRSPPKKERDRGKFQGEFGRPPAAEMAERIAGRGVDVQEAAEKLRATGDAYASEVAALLERQDPEAAEVKRLRQKNPGHPVAKKIRADSRASEIHDKFMDAVAVLGEDWPSDEELTKREDEAGKRLLAYTETMSESQWEKLPATDAKWKERIERTQAVTDVWKARAKAARLARSNLFDLCKAANEAPLSVEYHEKDSIPTAVYNALGGQVGRPTALVQTAFEVTQGILSKMVANCPDMDVALMAVPPGYRSGSFVEYDMMAVMTEKYGGESGDEEYGISSPLERAIATTMHELGHLIERKKPGLRDRCVEFLRYRTEGEAKVDIGTVAGLEIMKGEYGKKDDFDRAMPLSQAYYMGKTYVDSLLPGVDEVREWLGFVDSTEVLSVGLEQLWRDPIRMARQDPELFRFLIGAMLE